MKNTNDSILTPISKNSKITVGILFGGRSSEHEISLRSALYVLKSLPSKYKIIPIGISQTGEMHSLSGNFNSQDFKSYTIDDLFSIVAGKIPKNGNISKNYPSILYPVPQSTLNILNKPDSNLRNLNIEVDCLFPVLHGTNGEDGRLQGLFELADIPYIGCDQVSSVIGMDKDIQKRLVREAGIATANYISVTYNEFQSIFSEISNKIESSIGYPCCIKPNSLGSTIGVSKVHKFNELKPAFIEAFKYDCKVLAEEWIQGTEIECAFLGDANNPRISTPGEICTENFYSYNEKYSTESMATLFVPARLNEKRISILQDQARKIAAILGLRGFARLDFWNIETENKFIFSEVNSIPGLTSISMFPKLWEYDGVSAQMWLEELIENAFQYK